MPKNFPIGFKDLVDKFESFVTLYPNEIDKDVVETMRNEFSAIRAKANYTYPPPLIKVKDNGQFALELNND